MSKRNWRIAWYVSGALVALHALSWGDEFWRRQADHPWYAQVIALGSLQGCIACTIWVFLEQRDENREKRCEG